MFHFTTNPHVAAWQGKLARMPKWGWLVVGIFGLLIIALLAVVVAVGLVVALVRALVRGVFGLLGFRRNPQPLAGPRDAIVVQSVRVIDTPAR